ncbi:hypothetical protein EVAR_79467_1 [Eumeta japonica]|uniref:Uncharacterized protein n=1 Tax=Eumeta variegata TaxID=151549 RepID=A0A4C1UDZ7_EUMVA|nr:hypothetical protein EVAR_79467_1 [Eumeta japonica]
MPRIYRTAVGASAGQSIGPPGDRSPTAFRTEIGHRGRERSRARPDRDGIGKTEESPAHRSRGRRAAGGGTANQNRVSAGRLRLRDAV